MTELRTFKGKSYESFEEEPSMFAVALPLDLFVIDTTGCVNTRRVLIDENGCEILRSPTWDDAADNNEYDRYLSDFYGAVKAHIDSRIQRGAW